MLARAAKRRFARPDNYLFLLVLAAVVLSALVIKNAFYHHLLVLTFLMGGLAVSWNIVGGFARQLALGHGAFVGIGGYVAHVLYVDLHVTPLLSFLIAGISAAAIGGLLTYPCFRLRSLFFGMATVALLQIVRSVFTTWRVKLGAIDAYIPFEPSALNLIFNGKLPYVWMTLIYLLATLAIAFAIQESKFGQYLRALGEDEDAAETLGVPAARCKLFAFLVSAFLTAIGGCILVWYLLFITPDLVFDLAFSVLFALYSIVGGIGTIAGPVVGAFLLVPLDTYFRAAIGASFGPIGFVVYGTLLMSVSMLAPDGLLPKIDRWLAPLYARMPGARSRTVAAEHFTGNPLVSSVPIAPQVASTSEGSILQVQDLSKQFGGLQALSHLSLEIRRGEILGLIGPNGAGKTTLFNVLSGILPLDTGHIVFDGHNITKVRFPHNITRLGIARTFQLVKPFPALTVVDAIRVGALLHAPIEEAGAQAERIAHLVELGPYLHHRPSQISLAYQKRLEIARAIATQPRLLLLDEALAGLNPAQKSRMLEVLRRLRQTLDLTMIVIEHDMKALIELVDRTVVMHGGTVLAQGDPRDVLREPAVIEAYMGRRAAIDVNR